MSCTRHVEPGITGVSEYPFGSSRISSLMSASLRQVNSVVKYGNCSYFAKPAEGQLH